MGSLIYTEDGRYVVTSVSDCERFCEITPGCQAYVYCNNPNGCGYCSAYMEEYGNGEQPYSLTCAAVATTAAPSQAHWLCCAGHSKAIH